MKLRTVTWPTSFRKTFSSTVSFRNGRAAARNRRLEPLDKSALIRVLTEPRNAIVKQYQQLFSFDNVELEFTAGALTAAAERALAHQTGARCLRYVIEETCLT